MNVPPTLVPHLVPRSAIPWRMIISANVSAGFWGRTARSILMSVCQNPVRMVANARMVPADTLAFAQRDSQE